MIIARVPTALIKRFATLNKYGPAICTASGIGLMLTAIGLGISETPSAFSLSFRKLSLSVMNVL